MAAHIPITPEDIQRTEAVLLGSLLLHPDTGNAVRDRLQLEDFSEERHRLIYEALLTVLGTPRLDTVEALSVLLMEHELARIGGVAYLSALKQQAESTTMPIEDQAYLLKQATLHRLLSQIGETFRTRTVQYDGDDLKQVIDDLERAIRVAQQMLSPKDTLPPHMVPFQADLDDYLSDLNTRLSQNTVLTGIPTGFVDLDMITGGLQRSDLIIIAGPPSCRKTSFALSIALHVLLKEHRSVGLFSLEAPKRQVIGRLLSMEADLDQRLLRLLEMEDDEWTRLGEASTALSDAKLWIDDTANLSTAQLNDKAHLLVAHCGVELLVVDYAHLMLSSINDKRHENRVQEVGEISRSLKALARDLTIPVLALAQVSRAFESRPTKNLQLSDLRDGSLENDADLVLFLSVSEADTTEIVGAPQLATISIAKHRNGPRASLDVCFLPGTIRFRDLQALSQTSALEQAASSAPTPSNQPMTQFPRLQEIMARAVKRQPRQKDITSPPNPFQQNTPLGLTALPTDTVEVTDPTHPLYGLSFPLIGITVKQRLGRVCLVWLHPGIERAIPVNATNLAGEDRAHSACRLSIAGLQALLHVLSSLVCPSQEDAHEPTESTHRSTAIHSSASLAVSRRRTDVDLTPNTGGLRVCPTRLGNLATGHTDGSQGHAAARL